MTSSTHLTETDHREAQAAAADAAMERVVGRPGNLADRAAASADSAISATHRAADAVLNGVSRKVENLRTRVSPVVDRVSHPLEAVTARTVNAPLRSLLVAAATGAAAMALLAVAVKMRRRA